MIVVKGCTLSLAVVGLALSTSSSDAALTLRRGQADAKPQDEGIVGGFSGSDKPLAMRNEDETDSDRWAILGEPAEVGPSGAQSAGLMVNKPLLGLRTLSKADSQSLCGSFQCAHIPTEFFQNAKEFKSSPCVVSELTNQAVNKEKIVKESGISEPIKEFCRELYSLENCLDTKGATTDFELQSLKVYLTGIQCLRHQEFPYMCSCTPFGTPELTSSREAMQNYILKPDGTRMPRPSHFPEHLLAKHKRTATVSDDIGVAGGEGATGSATGGETGGATGTSTGGATGGATGSASGSASGSATGPDEADLNIESPPLDQRSKRR